MLLLYIITVKKLTPMTGFVVLFFTIRVHFCLDFRDIISIPHVNKDVCTWAGDLQFPVNTVNHDQILHLNDYHMSDIKDDLISRLPLLH